MKKLLFLFLIFLICPGVGCNPNLKTAITSNSSALSTKGRADAAPTSTTDLSVLRSKNFTETDFNGFGLSEPALIDQNEFAFKVKINPNLPAYQFKVVSFSSNTQGFIEVSSEDKTKQTLLMDLGGLPALQIPQFFNVSDINFDGYADIGVGVEGGALWVSYQYWVYDQKTGHFVSAPVTDDFRKIHSGLSLTFDKAKKQVISTGLSAASLSYKNTYQFNKGRLLPLEKIQHENIIVQDDRANTPNPTIHCEIKVTKYSSAKVKTYNQILNQECPVNLTKAVF